MIRRLVLILLFLSSLVILSPALHAQADNGVSVFSFTTISGNFVVSECATAMNGDLPDFYNGVQSICSMNVSGTPNGSFSCGGSGFTDALCVKDFPIISGSTYTTTGQHVLLFPFDSVDGEFIDFFDYIDVFEFFGPRQCDSGTCTFFGFDDETVGTTFDGVVVADSSDSINTAPITISPSSVVLTGSGKTQQFTSDVSAKWNIVSGPGSLSPAPGTVTTSVTYTGPNPLTQSGQASIEVCDANDVNKCAIATVNLVPVTVTVEPSAVGVIPGTQQQFTATASDGSTGFIWTLSGPGNLSGTAPNLVPPYTAPTQDKLGGQTVTATVTACGTVETKSCGSAEIQVSPITITVSGASAILGTAGAQTQFSASVIGSPSITAVTWTVTGGGPTGGGTIDTNGLYTAPTPAVTTVTTVNITACLAAPAPANLICSAPFPLSVSPPVAVTTIGALNSGQSNVITIQGAGFGTAPASVNFPGASFTPSGTQTNTSIPGILTIPPLSTSTIVQVQVTSTGNPVNSTGSLFVTYSAVAASVSLFPGNATLLETQSQTFTPTVTCKTAGNITCTIPTTVTCSLSPNIGTVTQGPTTNCVYTATATITGQQPVAVQLKACSTFSTGACATAPISLTPLNVTVTPTVATVNGGQTQKFQAAVTGAVNSNQGVTWSITPAVGAIDQSGLYTAPNPIVSSQPVTVKACSQIDSNVCGQGTVNLTPISVAVSPSAVSLSPGGTQQFTSTVTGTSNSGVTWSIVAGGLGTISSGGLYTAPPPPNTTQQTVTVKACSVVTPAPPNPCGTATVTLLPSPDFSVSVAPTPQTVTAGGSASYTVTVNPSNGFTGTVNFTCSVSPADPTVTLTGCPSSVTITSGASPFTFQANTTTSTPSRAYTIAVSGTSVSPSITHSTSAVLNVVNVTLSPLSLTFPGQVVGTTSTAQVVTLNNNSASPLSITGITVSGDYAQTNNCGSTVAANASCTIAVTFTPTATGARSGLLSVTDSALGSPQTVSLSGTGTAPGASLSPTSLIFASQAVGTTSASQTIVLTNTGTGPLTINSITTSGDFAQTNNCGTTLAAGASCTITVTFTPTATGARSGSLSVADNAAGGPQTVSLSGTGMAPGAIVSPTSLTFGILPIGTTSAPQTVTLTNNGTGPLSITGITVVLVSGTDTTGTGGFAQTNNCGSTLAVNASCTISVTFTAFDVGTFTAALNIADNAAGGQQSVSLSGSGKQKSVCDVGPTTCDVIAPATGLAFGSTLVGTASAPQTATLSNIGTGPITISSITISGGFAQTNTCGTTLAAGASCTINVTFTPTVTGAGTGALNVNDNGVGSPHSVNLSGTGIAPAACLSPGSLTFASQLVNTTSPVQAVTLTNCGSAALTVSSIATSVATSQMASGNFSQSNNCPGSLAVNASCTINVSFRPTVNGTLTGRLNVTDNAPGSPHNISLTGTGFSPDFSLSISGPQTVDPTVTGQAVFTYNVSFVNGATGNVSVSIDNTVFNFASPSLSPTTFTSSGSGTLTLLLSSGLAPGTYTVTLTGTGGGFTHVATTTLTIVNNSPPPPSGAI